LDSFSLRPVFRLRSIFDDLLRLRERTLPDVICLQEVTPIIRHSILEDKHTMHRRCFSDYAGLLLSPNNIHMESRLAVSRYHAEQVHTLANVLREPGCSGGVLAGTFNAVQLDDHQLLDKNGLTDAWVALHGTSASGGDTWNVGVMHWEGIGGHRLDKIAMMGVQAEEMEVLRRGCIDVPRPDGEGYVEVPWSEHMYHCTLMRRAALVYYCSCLFGF
jgi:hypothetical protein